MVLEQVLLDETLTPAPTVHQRLTDLRNGLLRLHKTLLDSETRLYQRDMAPIHSRGQLLGLVMDDPWFAYLHDLSRLVVEIDEALDAPEGATSVQVTGFVRRARIMLIPAEEGRGFEKRYWDALQRDPDVVLAHGATVKLLNSLSE